MTVRRPRFSPGQPGVFLSPCLRDERQTWKVTRDVTGDRPLCVLPDEVVQRILQELPARGEKVVSCMRTAAELIKLAVEDERGLRLAESGGYNLREALEAVVVDQPRASEVLPEVLRAWERYSAQVIGSEEKAAALEDLEQALAQLSAKRERSSIHASRLLGYLRARTGVDPLEGELSPIQEYNKLRKDANSALHSSAALDAVLALYERAVAWFIRMFTPPDAIVGQLGVLAAEPWSGPEQLERLRTLATDPHHLRLFLGRLTDPRWLEPLYDAQILGMPQPDDPWPAVALLNGLAQTTPQAVTALLLRILADSKREPGNMQLGIVFELLRMATQLGEAGHEVVARIPRKHYKYHAVRSLAVSVARRAPANDAIVMNVADAALMESLSPSDRYYLDVVLDHLVQGLDATNVADRTRMVAAKVRAATRAPEFKFLVLDRAALTVDLDHERDSIAVLLHHLARMLERAHALGLPSSELLEWTGGIPGEAGERLRCRILAMADDIALEVKITHVVARLSSPSVTGDDRDLVDAIMRSDPDLEVLDMWTAALGTPSELPSGSAALPDDWARAWRWSMVLPPKVLEPWAEAIASVTAKYKSPDPTILDRRSNYELASACSPYTEAELATIPVLEAAKKVADWRPNAAGDWDMLSARELARTLEAVVKANPENWTRNPTEIVKTLREPVYVLHYFDALKAQAKVVAKAAPEILNAAALVREARWEPAALGDDDFDYEPGWHNVDTEIVEVAASLANANGDLHGHLDAVWEWASELLDLDDGTAEEATEGVSDSWDALHEAINSPRGRACQSALVFAGWEFRNLDGAQPRFLLLLDRMVTQTGQAGREYRAILARDRPFLEHVVPEWLGRNANALFRDGAAGREGFELTLKYARPTSWLLSYFREELFAAAQSQATNAIDWLLIGTLKQEDGYGLDAVMAGLKGVTSALAAACGAMARLAQDLEADSSELEIALEFWRKLLTAEDIPPEALRPGGRWAFVTGLADETWTSLTRDTLVLTGGRIDFLIEVADRAADTLNPDSTPEVFLLLLGKGEPWERGYVADKALEALTTLASDTSNDGLRSLRTRLLDLGHHRAAEIDLGNA
jgi:hypothetical protein